MVDVGPHEVVFVLLIFLKQAQTTTTTANTIVAIASVKISRVHVEPVFIKRVIVLVVVLVKAVTIPGLAEQDKTQAPTKQQLHPMHAMHKHSPRQSNQLCTFELGILVALGQGAQKVILLLIVRAGAVVEAASQRPTSGGNNPT